MLSTSHMNTLSPVVSDAFRLLRQDLYLHLDTAEFLAARYDAWSEADAAAARSLIQDLVTVLRGVVALHDTPVAGGRCRTCDSYWPCQAFETVHKLLKEPDRQFVRLVAKTEPL